MTARTQQSLRLLAAATLAAGLVALTADESVARAPTRQATAQIIDGVVVGVHDGDTVTLLDETQTQHRIRLRGIDAPESRQPFGTRSKQSLSDLAFRREARAHCAVIDRFGRPVCAVSVGGIDVGLHQISHGMAWHFERFARDQPPHERAAYAAAQRAAQQARRGLWSDPQPVAPWDWRQARQK